MELFPTRHQVRAIEEKNLRRKITYFKNWTLFKEYDCYGLFKVSFGSKIILINS